MMLMQETKLKELNSFILQSMCGAFKTDFVHVDADGSSGGLITVWKSDFFKLESSYCNRRFILVETSMKSEIHMKGRVVQTGKEECLISTVSLRPWR